MSLSLSLTLITVFVLFSGNRKEDEETQQEQARGTWVVTPVKLPDHLEFAGEKVPLDNFDVRESLDRELLVNVYWQSHTLLLAKRANRYFPVIERVLRENGLPSDLIYIAVAESDLENVKSPAGAVGFWQFLEGTARDFGLEVNDEVDERYHLEKSTLAAGRYLKASYDKYGSWTMAAASYNAGRRGMDRRIRQQGAGSYYDLLLNSETARYVYRILALKLILSNPGDYGFEIFPEDMYPVIPTYEVTVDGNVEDFADWAGRYGINYKILKYFNPWLRDTALTNPEETTYYISIPEEGFRFFGEDRGSEG